MQILIPIIGMLGLLLMGAALVAPSYLESKRVEAAKKIPIGTVVRPKHTLNHRSFVYARVGDELAVPGGKYGVQLFWFKADELEVIALPEIKDVLAP